MGGAGAMTRWKPWQFGRVARSLPVVRDPAEWPGTVLPPVESPVRSYRHPSGSVPEGLEAVIANPGAFLVKKRRAWDIHKYARLHTGEYYLTAPVHHCVAHNAWLHVPSGFVIDSERRVLGFSSYGLNCLYEGHAPSGWDNAPMINAPAFTMATAWGNNYAHWLMDALPKAGVMESGLAEKVVLDKPSPAFQRRTLQLLGAPDCMEPVVELLRFRELHFVSCGRSGIPHPAPLLRARDRLRTAAGVESATHSERIYLSRQKTRRRIVNGDEIGRVLEAWGFREVFAEDLDMAEQIAIFSRAAAVFGAHGAGTMNVLFQPAGSALIEAINPRVWDHAAHRVASLCGVRHYHLFAENASRELDVRIDAQTLERTLALALEPESHPALLEKVF